MLPIGQILHQSLGLKIIPISIAILPDIIHIDLNASAIFSGLLPALTSFKVKILIIAIKTSHLNHDFLNIDGISLLKLNKESTLS
ncbi:MAG: hypothetical protein A3K30_02110 [Deltaproteobacteria bacterium RBG_13_51_10]|nr:MAG: hypothetical protein A3K30_02110 [Deltaproteobacteria bacterium RBG_13_51_10]